MEAHEKCFLHKKSFEVITVPDEFYFDEGLEEDPWEEDFKKIEADKINFVEIEKMPSDKAFEMMEEFIDSLENRSVKIILLQSIEGRKPFANFKHQIENAGLERELWFAFRRHRNIEWIEKQLEQL